MYEITGDPVDDALCLIDPGSREAVEEDTPASE